MAEPLVPGDMPLPGCEPCEDDRHDQCSGRVYHADGEMVSWCQCRCDAPWYTL